MTALAYYDDLGSHEDAELLTVWADSWRRCGWNPVVLGKADARRHPKYDEFSATVSTFPTVNHKGFEMACYQRWLAFAMNAPALVVDYDIINFGLRPEDVPWHEPVTLLDKYATRVPLYATRDWLELVIETLHTWRGPPDTIRGQPHTSDMYIMITAFRDKPMPLEHRVELIGHDNSRDALLVHFDGPTCKGRKLARIAEEFKRRAYDAGGIVLA